MIELIDTGVFVEVQQQEQQEKGQEKGQVKEQEQEDEQEEPVSLFDLTSSTTTTHVRLFLFTYV